MVGSTIGQYRVTRLLGEGGMGAVYEAVNESIERRVAIKLLHPDYARKPEIVTRFFNEARAVNRAAHPSIVQVHEHGHLPDGTAFIVMELLDGETLSQRLQRTGGRLPIKTALQIAWQVSAALTAAHAKGIVHRDLKPSNLMLVADPLGPGGERVKVLDFGLAKLVADARGARTSSNVIMGTPLYMSPEQCRGAGAVDEKTDVYSLGIILYEMLAGRPPFTADGGGELIGMHLFQPPPALASVAPELPGSVVEFVHQLLSKEKAQRPGMPAVSETLSRLVLSDEVSASSSSTNNVNLLEPRQNNQKYIAQESTIRIPTTQSQELGNRRRRRLLVLAGCITILVVFGIVLLGKSSQNNRQAERPLDQGILKESSQLKNEEKQELTGSDFPGAKEEPKSASANRGDKTTPKMKKEEKNTSASSSQSAGPSRKSEASLKSTNTPKSTSAKTNAPQEIPSEKIIHTAEEHLRLGRWQAAIREASTPSVLEAQPERAWRVIGIAACHGLDLLAFLDARENLTADARNYVENSCAKDGFLYVGNKLMRRQDAESILNDAQRDYDAGSYQKAIKQAKSVQIASPAKAWLLIGSAACNIKDRHLANNAYGELSSDSKARLQIVGICEQQGISIPFSRNKIVD